MADQKNIFGVIEIGTYMTDAPNPHVNLLAVSPTISAIAQLFSEALSDGQTVSAVVRKDTDNWAVYENALFTTGSPNIVDLSTATLKESQGSIASGSTVNVWVLESITDSLVTAPSTPTSSGTEGQIAWSSPYLYWCVAEDTWVRTAPIRSW